MRRNVDKYLRDVELIKGLLQEREDRVLLRPWALFAWAAVVAGATFLSVHLWRDAGWSAGRITWVVWVSALLVGGVAETVAWIQFLRREQPVAFTSEHIKLIGSFPGVFLAVCLVAFVLVAQGTDVSLILLPLFSICLFVLAVFSFKSLFLEAYGSLAAALVLIALDLPPSAAYQVAGYGTAIVFLTCGLHTRYILNRRHG